MKRNIVFISALLLLIAMFWKLYNTTSNVNYEHDIIQSQLDSTQILSTELDSVLYTLIDNFEQRDSIINNLKHSKPELYNTLYNTITDTNIVVDTIPYIDTITVSVYDTTVIFDTVQYIDLVSPTTTPPTVDTPKRKRRRSTKKQF